MQFLSYNDEMDLKAREKIFNNYQDHLRANKNRIPERVFEFAMADWHYNHNNKRCPHDAWLQELMIKVIATGERQQIRSTQIQMTLLGAYHDRTLHLIYLDVASHRIESKSSSRSYGDWLIDEIRVSPSGSFVHEIEFALANIAIECRNLIFEERLFKPDPSPIPVAPLS